VKQKFKKQTLLLALLIPKLKRDMPLPIRKQDPEKQLWLPAPWGARLLCGSLPLSTPAVPSGCLSLRGHIHFPSLRQGRGHLYHSKICPCCYQSTQPWILWLNWRSKLRRGKDFIRVRILMGRTLEHETVLRIQSRLLPSRSRGKLMWPEVLTIAPSWTG
jgi:hypothetical protein